MVMQRMKKRLGVSILLIFLFSMVISVNANAATRPDAVGTRAMVTSAHSLATMAGIDILKKGGNAFDAAVAVASTLNVVEPNASGLGGNGFVTVYAATTGEVYSLHMTGAAPYAATSEAYGGKDGQDFGYLAGCVPGNFGGWIALLERFGTLSLGQVLQTAIGYAEKGFPVDPFLAQFLEDNKKTLDLFPSSARVYVKDGKVAKAGEMLVQKDLANTFKRLVAAEQKAKKAGKDRKQALMAAHDLFYKGDIAREFAAFYKENGGFFTAKDFADYKPFWGKPVHTRYKGIDVYTNGPTTRGGVQTIMELNFLEGYDLKQIGHNSADYIQLLSEVIKIVNADVYGFLCDPKFTKIPLEGMLSKEYASERRKLISLEKTNAYGEAGNPAAFQKSASRPIALPATLQAASLVTGNPEASYQDTKSTTHFDIVDEKGNVVACTPTLGSWFGTKVVVGNTGVFFNNGTRYGSVAPYKENVNFVGGGKIPLLGNSPLIALKNGKPFMVWGTPGGEGIGQTQMQVFLNVVEFGMRIQDAIEAPRMSLVAKPDFYKPGAEITVTFEPRIPEDIRQALEAKGNKIRVDKKDFSNAFGGMQGILVNQENGSLTGGGDPRRGGYAIGY
ncbi:MAG: gamma-glutamyltransferase [Deltaproteobacteria bacterium]|nr:gamma-glutamyltransferase [Deltaproteobacteria bacterium]